MRCIKCGENFGVSDILIMEEDDVPICDSCAMNEMIFLITYENDEYIVQADDFVEAIEKWRERVEKLQPIYAERFSPSGFTVKRIENIILNDY